MNHLVNSVSCFDRGAFTLRISQCMFRLPLPYVATVLHFTPIGAPPLLCAFTIYFRTFCTPLLFSKTWRVLRHSTSSNRTINDTQFVLLYTFFISLIGGATSAGHVTFWWRFDYRTKFTKVTEPKNTADSSVQRDRKANGENSWLKFEVGFESSFHRSSIVEFIFVFWAQYHSTLVI